MTEMMTDMFASAVTVKAPVAAKASSDALQVSNTLEILGAIDTIVDSFNAVREHFESELKAEVRPQFLQIGANLGHQPDNLKLEGPAGTTCSAEWRKRSSRSVLTKDEVKRLDAMGLQKAHKLEVTQQAVEERFFFNGELLSDPTIRAAISKALQSVPELQGKEVILRQPAVAEVSKEVVTDSAISEVFKLEKMEDISAAMRIVSTSAFKVKPNGNLEEAFKTVEKVEGLQALVNKAKKA